MENRIPGIHHVTAIASDAQQNIDFYTGVLGLRLVKLTVNFDDPGAYHLYYGDGAGTPGTIMTFFTCPGVPRGRQGAGQVTATAFAIPRNAVAFWQDRLSKHGVEAAAPIERFDSQVIAFAEPDGLPLELVAGDLTVRETAWRHASIDPVHAIAGFHGVTLLEQETVPTQTLLEKVMGFQIVDQSGGRTRFHSAESGIGSAVDIVIAPNQPQGRVSVGTVHHVAWRTPTDDAQANWHQTLSKSGYNVSPVKDRVYFHSIYYREPGGVLFEIATDPPGFTVDELLDALGTSLRLPPWFENARNEIEKVLAPIKLPASEGSKA